MQDRYAGDVGDFGKFALLRTVAKGRALAVCWYRNAGAGERNNDGGHVSYEGLRSLEPEVFDAMSRVVASGRSVEALEGCGLLPGAKYHRALVPSQAFARTRWFTAMLKEVDGCDLVFTDADNGFEWGTLSPKCVAREEVRGLRRRGRALLLYHHQTRRLGGAAVEYHRFASWLFDVGARSVEAVRLRPFSSRFYLLVDGDARLSVALRAFARHWGDRAEYFARVSRA